MKAGSAKYFYLLTMNLQTVLLNKIWQVPDCEQR